MLIAFRRYPSHQIEQGPEQQAVWGILRAREKAIGQTTHINRDASTLCPLTWRSILQAHRRGAKFLTNVIDQYYEL